LRRAKPQLSLKISGQSSALQCGPTRAPVLHVFTSCQSKQFLLLQLRSVADRKRTLKRLDLYLTQRN